MKSIYKQLSDTEGEIRYLRRKRNGIDQRIHNLEIKLKDLKEKL